MKKKREVLFPFGDEMRLHIRKMKLTAILLFIVCVTFGNSFSQVRLTVRFEKTDIRNVLQTIEEKTDYIFLYKDEIFDFSKKVTSDFKDAKFEEVLEDFCDQTNISYEIRDRQIILKEKVISYLPVEQQPQKKEIKGIVTDSNGESMPGVSVVVKGTNTGTITDAEGNFSLQIPAEAKTLRFSFVGMQNQEIAIANKSTINVILLEDAVGIEEVVAVGYRSQTKSSLTTAVSTVQGNELSKQSTGDVRKALQGSVPGLTIIDQGGAPGSEDVQLRIRGITSINSVQPLVIVDGVEQGINNVDANAIESVSVLKDAASTSIYGSRGANGVIIITTKKGAEGKMSITYNGFYGNSYLTKFPEPMDTREFMEFRNLVYENSGAAIPFPDVDGYIEKMEKYPDLYPKAFPSWNEFYELAPVTKHSLVITGGSAKIKSMVNLSVEDKTGIIPGTHSNDYQFRTNNELKITDNIKTFFDISLNRNDWYKPNIDDSNYRFISNMFEFQNPHFPDGTYGATQDRSPWFLTNSKYQGTNNTITDNAILSLGTEIKFLKDFTYKLTYSINAGRDMISANLPRYIYYQYWNENTIQAKRDINVYSEDRNERLRTTLTELLIYQHTFLDRHDLNILLGYSEDEFKSTGVFAQGQDFYNNEIRNMAQGDPENRVISNSFSEWGLRSFFGRIGYSYNQKYFIEANGRYDGSSRFPAGNKYSFFPSASVAWRISEEPFWESIRKSVNSFKIRYSYGVTGNQSIGNYSYIPQLNVNNAYVFADQSGNEGLVTTVGQNTLASTELSWETTSQNNLGVDLTFIKNKLSFSFDLFDKITDGILLDVPVPAVVGLNPSKTNAGIISNKGWEAVIIWKDKIKDFSYSISANASFVEDKIEDFGGLPKQIMSEYSNYYYRAEGTPLYALYGYVDEGFYKDQADIDNSAALGSKGALFPGDLKYKDISGPNGIPDGIISLEYDATDLGFGTPRYFYGFNINTIWKGIDVAMNWQGAGGYKIPLSGKIIENGGWDGFAPHYSGKDYWTGPEDVNARFPFPHSKPKNNVVPSSFWLISGNYLRLKSLTIGYTIPAKWTNKVKLSSVRLYTNAMNLFTISELYKKWELDPEWNMGKMRYDYYPQTKSFNVGISVTF